MQAPPLACCDIYQWYLFPCSCQPTPFLYLYSRLILLLSLFPWEIPRILSYSVWCATRLWAISWCILLFAFLSCSPRLQTFFLSHTTSVIASWDSSVHSSPLGKKCSAHFSSLPRNTSVKQQSNYFLRGFSLLFCHLSSRYYHIWKANLFLFTTWLL